MLEPVLGKICRNVRSRLLIILLLFIYGSSNAAVYYSRTSGNWNSANTWSTVACNGTAAATFPGAADDVIICSGHTITVTVSASARTLDVRGIIITKDNIILTVEGNVIVQNTGELYLTGSASCNANEESTLIVKGNYTNFGTSCFNKSWVIVSGDINSPSATGIQNNGYLVVGGNAAGIINQTGGQSVYAANPYASVTLTGTTPVLSPPTSPAGLVDLVNAIIYGGTCGFTINGPANVAACSSGPVDFVIISTTAASPAYQWEVNSGYGWVLLGNSGIYSGVTTPVLNISNAAGLNGYIYRCKVTSGGCSKYSFAGTLTVTATPPPSAPVVGTITQPTCASSTGTVILSGLPAGNWTINPGAITGSTATATISGLATGTYNFTVRNSVGCVSAASAGVAISAQPTPPSAATFSITQPTCTVTTGSISITAPITGYEYNIDGGTYQSSTVFSNVAPGNHTILVRRSSDNTCISNAVTATINTAPAAPASATFNVTQPTCAVATGTITVTAPVTGYEYNIDNGTYQSSATFSNVAAGSHSIRVRRISDNTCISAPVTANVSAQPTAPATASFSITQPTCSVATGTITITAPTGAFDYNIDGGTYQSSTTFNNVAAGIHNIRVRRTSDNTCVSGIVTATVNSQPATPSAPSVGTVTQPTCATATGSTELTGLPAGNWTINPGGITGSTAATTISGLATGTHSFTVTNAAGCTSALSSNIMIGSQPVTPAAPIVGTITQPTCSLATGSVILSGLSAGNWTVNPGGITGNTAATTISGLAEGTYNFTVTNSAGCVSLSSVVVINAQPATPLAPVVGTITHATCGLPTGSVTLSDLPAGNWTINPGGINGNTLTTTISGLSVGTRAFTVTNAAGCTSPASADVVINAPAGSPAAATLTIDQPTCSVSTGTITITAPVTGYEYNLDGGAYQASPVFNNVAPGGHTILVRRASDNSCISAPVTATINSQPATPGAPVAGLITHPTCAISTGSVVLSGLPSGNWTINPGGITGNTATTTISGLSSGTHNFTVTNDAGCTSVASANAVINAAAGAPSAPVVGTITQPTCLLATGSVDLSGLPAGNWTINPGTITGNAGTTTVAGLAPGTHNFTVTNSLGCISAASVDVVINAAAGAPAAATFTLVQPTCTVSTGTITITAPVTGYEYNLDGGSYQASTVFSNVAPGGHTILVRRTSDNSCISAPVTATINSQPATPGAPVAGLITHPTCAISTGSVVLSGLPSGNWIINPGGITGNTATTTISGLSSGIHNFTVTNDAGCTSVASANAVINAAAGAPSAPVVGTITQPTCLLATGSVDLSGLPAGNWTINPGTITGNAGTTTVAGLAPGTHNFTVTNSLGCISAASVDVVINAQPVTSPAPVIGTITQPTCATPTGIVEISGLPTGNWTINPGAINGNTATTTITGLGAGTHTFTVTNEAGCTSSASANVVINAPAGAPAEATFMIVQPTCSVSTGTITITGPLTGYEYKLDAGAYQAVTTFSSAAVGAHTILVRRTSDNSCISAGVTATINSQPVTPPAPVIGAITQPTCATATGSVFLSGLPAGNWTIYPGTITGSTASTTISGLSSGTHNFTVKNEDGCTSTASADVVITAAAGPPAAATVSITQPGCAVSTGVINITSPTGLYDYGIDGVYQGSPTFSNVAPGDHTILVRRSSDNTCISAPVTATVNPQPLTPVAPTVGSITQPTCSSAAGSVVLSGLPAGNWTINPGLIAGSTITSTITGLATGTYNFTVTNAAGCISPASVNVVINGQPAAPGNATFNVIQPTCAISTGTINITGPAGAFEFNIDGGTYQAGTTFNNVTSGDHLILVRRSSDHTCVSNAATATVSAQPSAPAAATFSITQPTCSVAKGTITITAPFTGYEYNIDNGAYQASAVFNNVSAGNHTILVRRTSDINCISPAATAVVNAQPATPSAPAAGTIAQPTCGQATGSVALTGLPAGNWTINPGTITGNAGTTTIAGLAPGTYNFTVTNDAGCTSSASANVVINAQPAPPASAAFTVIQPTCSSGGMITITAPAGGYEYSIDGGAYQASTAFNNVTAGNHSIVVRRPGDNTCISSPVIAVVNPQPAIPAAPVTGTITQPTCALATGSVVLSGLPSGNWTINPGSIADNTAATTISGLSAGTYNFTVTNDAGCTSAATVNVVINSQDALTAPIVGAITQPTCAVSTGSVVLSGLPAGTWTINPGGIAGNTATTTITGLAAGNHAFTLTNEAGCTSSASANVVINTQAGAPSPATFTITQPTCASGTGTINITGPTGAFEYSIDAGAYQASASFGNVAAGNHTILVRRSADNTCISAPVTAIVNSAPAAPSAPIAGNITQPTCGTATGSVSLSGLPAGNWTINPGAKSGNTATADISGLAPGTYAFTVKDAVGCISAPSANVVITNTASDLSVTLSKTNVLCKGGNTGAVVLAGSGGSAPYRYRMGTGQYQDSGTFGNLTAGDYTFTITDSEQCTSTVAVSVSEPDELAFTYTSEEASCLTTPDGAVTITVSGGVDPYKVLWSDGLSSSTRNDLLPGTQKFIVSDANGCSSAFDLEVSNKENPDCIQVQEIMTPNNDGFYDTWKIRNIGMYPEAEVQVFNRWGEKVFSTKNLQANEWDGTYNGKPLPTDSYHFILYLQKGMKPLTGTITIVR